MTGGRERFRLATLACICGALLVAALIAWRDSRPARADFLVFSGRTAACLLIRPEGAGATDDAALLLLRTTIAEAAGVAPEAIPQRSARPAPRSSPVRRIEFAPAAAAPADPLRRRVGYVITADRVLLTADHAEDREIAASWFLEQELGARWFMPGRLGREVTRRPELRLAPATRSTEPGYLSRNLGGMDTREQQDWFRHNRLNSLFHHGHTANRIISPEDMAKDPRLAPQLNGQPFIPPKGNTSWQPNLTSEAAIGQAASVLRTELARDSRKLTAVFGQNDSWSWDQSEATLAVIAPHRHFRHYPNYSNTLFAYLNAVAERLAPEFPDRFLSTYAYQWTENVPDFPVHPMVLPYLTADRSQWFCPDYAAEDRDLIRRWSRAGPRHFGLYDYFYGAPFYVPRPTLYAVTQPIPFAHEAGARGFYAECLPNWGLDGPKLWLAAQLLWDPRQSPGALLDEYYARFWQEAAAPMRAFIERCDRQYLQQPKPAYWLRYFKDDHQRLLFPPEVRAELRHLLETAAAQARTPRVRERVEMVRRAFALTGLFCRHDETRETLNRKLFSGTATPTQDLREVLTDYDQTRVLLLSELARLKREHPLALRADFIGDYSREDPRSVAWAELARRGVIVPLSADAVKMIFADRGPQPGEVRASGREVLQDRSLDTVQTRSSHPFTLVDWTTQTRPWHGRSEPFATLRRHLLPQPDGSRHLHFMGANQEAFYQHIRGVTPGALYHGRARVRAKVSPGNMTYLTVYFGDKDGRHVNWGTSQRLPVGDWSDGVELQVLLRAPATAVTVHYALCTYWQVDDDFAEWSDFSLQVYPP